MTRLTKALASLAATGLIAGIVIGVASAGLGGGPGLRSGTPAVGVSGRGPLFTLPALAPGTSATRSVVVSNSGDGAGTFVLGATTGGDRALLRQLRVTVTSGGVTLYSGPLASLASVRLGTLAPGGHARLVLRVSLPAAGDELQGLSASADFGVSATAA
jgi:hypothetical protein